MADINNIPEPEDTGSFVQGEVILTPNDRINRIEAYANKTYGKERSREKIKFLRRAKTMSDAELKGSLGIKDSTTIKKKMTPKQLADIQVLMTMPEALDTLEIVHAEAAKANPMIFGGPISGRVGEYGGAALAASVPIKEFETVRKVLYGPIARGVGQEKGTLSDFDAKTWEAAIPSMKDTPEQVQGNIRRLRAIAKNAAQTTLDGYTVEGYDVEGYKKFAEKKGLYTPAAPQGEPNVP